MKEYYHPQKIIPGIPIYINQILGYSSETGRTYLTSENKKVIQQ